MCTLVTGFHFQKSQTALKLSTLVFYVRSNTINRATAVPNREGKAKRQWMVATVHEEAPGSERLPQRSHTDDKGQVNRMRISHTP